MILSGSEIRKALDEGLVVIDPRPGDEQVDSTAVDLRLGEPLWIWDPELTGPGEKRIDIDRMNFKDLSDRYLIEVPREANGNYVIRPHTVYLASTHEKVELPADSRFAARIEGKSSLARLGLAVHITAPMIHCGSGLGIITLEMINHGPFSLEVTPGVTRLCQLILEQVLGHPEERRGKTFIDQKGPKG